MRQAWMLAFAGIVVAAGAILLVISRMGQADPDLLRPVAGIDLPGPPGQRFDYLLVDHDDGWLIAAHLGASQTYIIDLKTNAVLHTIVDTPGVEGLAYVPEQRKLYTSNAFDNTVGVVDLNAMKVVRKIPTDTKPDGIAYAAPFHKVYVSNEWAMAMAVIDTQTDAVVTTLRFDSQTGVPAYDSSSKLVYVNLQDVNQLAAIDPATDTLVGRYPVDGCEGNHGMALDTANHRAFLACQGNNRLVVIDLAARKVIAGFAIPEGSDVVDFDPGLGRVYVGCATGAIAVVQADDPTHYRLMANVLVEKNMHSLAVDVDTHRVYAPEQEESGVGVARMAVFEPVSAAGGRAL